MLQSYQPSNFVNESTLPGIEPGPDVLLAHNLAVMAEADFFLRPPTLIASNFAAL